MWVILFKKMYALLIGTLVTGKSLWTTSNEIERYIKNVPQPH
jgi:hypothetical protein